MKRYTRGFTLIELLVVIAIIGILSSVVLVSLNSARKKGNDTRVISDVNQLRTEFEADFSGGNYGNAFTPVTTVVGTVMGMSAVTVAADTEPATIQHDCNTPGVATVLSAGES